MQSGSPNMISFLSPAGIQVTQAHPLEQLLGFTVINPQRDSVFTKFLAVNDGVLAVYFTAKWCLPSLTFTPVLRQMYADLRRHGRKFEVVLVSFDRQEKEFNDLYSSMPWLAVPFDDYPKRVEIGRKYTVIDLPKLILLDIKTADIIARNGREIVLADPLGKDFPWRCKSFQSPPLDQKLRLNTISPGRQFNWHYSSHGFPLKTKPHMFNTNQTVRQANQYLDANKDLATSVGLPVPSNQLQSVVHSQSQQTISRNEAKFFDNSSFFTRTNTPVINHKTTRGPTTTPIQLVEKQANDFTEVMSKVLENRDKQYDIQRSFSPGQDISCELQGVKKHPLRRSNSDILQKFTFEPTEALTNTKDHDRSVFVQYQESDQYPQQMCDKEFLGRPRDNLQHAKSFEESRIGHHKGRLQTAGIAHDSQGPAFTHIHHDDHRTFRETPRGSPGPHAASRRNKSLPPSRRSSNHNSKDEHSASSVCAKVLVEPLELTSLMSGKTRHRMKTRSSKRTGYAWKSGKSAYSAAPGDGTTCSSEILYLTTTAGTIHASMPDHRQPHKSTQLHNIRPADFPRSSSAHHSVRQP